MIAYIIRLLFTSYTILLIIRLVGSWFPAVVGHPFMRFVGHYTDPYLNIFRRIIPPIGGMLDLSPILAFLGLQFLEYILLMMFR